MRSTKQNKFDGADVNAVVQNCSLFRDNLDDEGAGFQKSSYFYVGQKRDFYFLNLDQGGVLIVHPTLYFTHPNQKNDYIQQVSEAARVIPALTSSRDSNQTLDTDNMSIFDSQNNYLESSSHDIAADSSVAIEHSEKEEERDELTRDDFLQIDDSAEILSDNASTSDKRIIHLIPEVGSGRSSGSQHIRLRVVTQEAGKTFEESLNGKFFDPRDLGLGVQNTFDDTNCGRYVAAMTIQAAGLVRDGLSITEKNLKASPAVARALHFNSAEDAKKGLENAYVKPLSKNSTPQEIIDHNFAKIKCLKSEYESRVGNPDRAHHGTAICTAIFGGYVSSIFKAGYSAQEKLDAVTAIEKAFLPNGNLDSAKLPKAARQGELGKCVDAILKVQEARTEFVSRGRFGL